MRKIYVLLVALCSLVFMACEDKYEDKMPAQFVPKGEIVFEEPVSSFNFSGNEEVQQITFTANYDWKILPTMEWVSVEPDRGEQGTFTVKITTEKNPDNEARDAAMTFVVEKLRSQYLLHQQKGNIIETKRDEYLDLPKEGSDIVVELDYNIDFEIDYSGAQGWVMAQSYTLEEPVGDVKTITLKFDVDENEGYNSREGSVRIYNQERETEQVIKLSQEASIPIIIDQTQVHQVVAAQNQFSKTYLGAEIDFEVQVQSGDTWLRDAGSSWDSAQEEFTLLLDIDAHTDKTQTREAIVTLLNTEHDVERIVTIRQDEFNVDFVYDSASDPKTILETIASMNTEAKAAYTRVYIKGDGLVTEDFGAIKQLPNVKHIDISQTQTVEIPANTFASRTQLQTFIFPETSLTTIGITAFQKSGLVEVAIPKTVTSFGKSAFSNCFELKKVVLEEGLTVIGAQAFIESDATQVSKLEEVYIPASIITWDVDENLDSKAFANSLALKKVHFAEGLQSIARNAFLNSGLEEVTIPASVSFPMSGTKVNQAFSSCTSLDTIILQGGNSLENNPFSGCSSVAEVYCYAPIPPTLLSGKISPSVGTNVSGGTKVYALPEYLDAYKSSSWATYQIFAIE